VQTKNLNISKSTIPDSLMQQIRAMIISKKLKPGEELPSQRKMAAELGVGVPAIREALKIMDGMGLVEIRHGHSTIIKKVSVETLMSNMTPLLELTELDIMHLLETKDLIETQCAYVAATRASETEIKELEKIIKSMEKNLHNSREYAQLDYLFHLTIVKSVHNPVLNEMMTIAGKMIMKGIFITSTLPGRDIAMDYHRRIYEAIRDRNGTLASSLINEHILDTIKRLKESPNMKRINFVDEWI
jgi:GntR family transcriptional repressor for pyruvate dehydrogenase complex